MRIVLTMMGALALTACTQAGPEEPAPEPFETMMPVEPDGGIGDGATPLPDLLGPEGTGPNEALLEEDARRDAVARGIGPDAIPADYHGVWDNVDSKCARNSDGRVTIAGDTMTFYESTGKVTAIDAQTNGDKIITLSMTGEGETWERRLLLEMDSRAMRMVVSDLAAGPGSGNPLKRCD